MITSTQLGLNGDLALNLFRVATTIATAQKFSDNYIFPEWNFSANFPELKDKFAIPSTIIPNKVWNENADLSFNPISNIDKTVITDLRGVFLNKRYFESSASLLRFIFKTTIEEYNYAFIHILFNQDKNLFPQLDLNYYQDALSKMSSLRPDINTFLVVTDNIVKARSVFINSKDYTFKFTSSTSQVKQLQDMASCSAGILSNSLLSFWGAFLLEDNYIISPNSWFGKSFFHKENVNIFSSKWSLLKVSDKVVPDSGDIIVNEPNSGPPNFKPNNFLFNSSDPIGKKADTYTSENIANKGQANGYVPLNAYRKIPYIYIDNATTTSPGIVELAEMNESAAGLVVQSNDPRLSNTRIPVNHASSHVTGGTDVIPDSIPSGNSGLMSGADKAKLDGIEALATKNSTDAELRDRTTHTGQQAISTIAGLSSILDTKVADSFETVVSNLRTYNLIDTEFVPGVRIVKTYDVGSGSTIIVTTNFVSGLPNTKVLSGTALPPGIKTICTYDFTGRTVPLKTYT